MMFTCVLIAGFLWLENPEAGWIIRIDQFYWISPGGTGRVSIVDRTRNSLVLHGMSSFEAIAALRSCPEENDQ